MALPQREMPDDLLLDSYSRAVSDAVGSTWPWISRDCGRAAC